MFSYVKIRFFMKKKGLKMNILTSKNFLETLRRRIEDEEHLEEKMTGSFDKVIKPKLMDKLFILKL